MNCFHMNGHENGSTKLGTPNLERAALGTAKTELGTSFQVREYLERRTAKIFARQFSKDLERQKKAEKHLERPNAALGTATISNLF